MDNNNLTRLIAAAAKGRDVEGFTNESGWTEVLHPALETAREEAVQKLVKTLLARSGPQFDVLQSACGIAGEIAGIDSLITEINKAILAGRRAYDKVIEAGEVPLI